jgi:hypothetical protein
MIATVTRVSGRSRSETERGLSSAELLTALPSGPISLFPSYALFPFGDATPAVERVAINIVAFPSELCGLYGELRPTYLGESHIQIFGDPLPIKDPDRSFRSRPGALEEARAVKE